jgi:hypothetical protein
MSHGAETLVRLELSSGRIVQGVVDSRTDDDQLWLRNRVGTAELQRGIAWNEIKSGTLAGEAVTPAELKLHATMFATDGQSLSLPRRATTTLPVSKPTFVAPIESIACDAWLANWDRDALSDGLVLQVAAFDRDGNSVPFQGTIEAELLTIDYLPGYLASTSGGRVPTVLGRWSQPWKPETRSLRLAYQGRHPQLDGQLDRYAQLRVRMAIPGHGVFEQDLDGLRTRPFTPVQNALRR